VLRQCTWAFLILGLCCCCCCCCWARLSCHDEPVSTAMLITCSTHGSAGRTPAQQHQAWPSTFSGLLLLPPIWQSLLTTSNEDQSIQCPLGSVW
jgi:hypothetical protein